MQETLFSYYCPDGSAETILLVAQITPKGTVKSWDDLEQWHSTLRSTGQKNYVGPISRSDQALRHVATPSLPHMLG